jgi:PAS domain S-box-containing protein
VSDTSEGIMKVLIVDDTDYSRYLLERYLKQHGYKVFGARHGIEGLDMAKIHKPDVIISDILMPVMDGFNFLSALRENEDIRHIPFIFYSGTYTDDKSISLARSLGADGFIVKSETLEMFTEEMTKALKAIGDKKERPVPKLSDGEKEFLGRYVEILAVKLEKKVIELEETKRKIKDVAQSYEYLFNSIRDVIIVTDNDKNITRVNKQAFKELFGYDDKELKGDDIKVLFGNDDHYELLRKAVFDKKGYIHGKIIEANLQKKNGDVFNGEIYAMKLIGEYGMISGNICMIRDITKR